MVLLNAELTKIRSERCSAFWQRSGQTKEIISDKTKVDWVLLLITLLGGWGQRRSALFKNVLKKAGIDVHLRGSSKRQFPYREIPGLKLMTSHTHGASFFAGSLAYVIVKEGVALFPATAYFMKWYSLTASIFLYRIFGIVPEEVSNPCRMLGLNTNWTQKGWPYAYLPTLPDFPGVSKFFIKSPGLSECLLGDFRGLFLDIVFNDILAMQRFLDISRFLYPGGLAGMQNDTTWYYFCTIMTISKDSQELEILNIMYNSQREQTFRLSWGC